MAVCKVSMPHLGNYHIPLSVLFTLGFDIEYIVPPPISSKTLEIGSRHSPEFVCAPFKYTLGNFIEAIEAGADTLVQVAGSCRLDYYGELQELILADLGYKVNFINLAGMKKLDPLSVYLRLKQFNPQASLGRIARVLPLAVKMVEYMDKVEDYIRKNVDLRQIKICLKNTPGVFRDLRDAQPQGSGYPVQGHKKRFKNIEVQSPPIPLRVGIVVSIIQLWNPSAIILLRKNWLPKILL